MIRRVRTKVKCDLPSRENNGICIDRAPIVKLQTFRREAGYLSIILEFNLPVDYQLARANIYDSREVGGFCN
jgi:hypothetical protein